MTVEMLAMTLRNANRIHPGRAVWGDMPAVTRLGYVYATATDPARRPRRIKFGFAADPKQRLSSFRIVCPEATLLCALPSDTAFESHVIGLFAHSPVPDKRLGREVFDVHGSIGAALERLEFLHAIYFKAEYDLLLQFLEHHEPAYATAS